VIRNQVIPNNLVSSRSPRNKVY